MWIISLAILAFCQKDVAAGKVEECQILQTTDPKTPCHILVRNPGHLRVPPFVYMLNLPRPSPEIPCPLSQTLDPTLTCYVDRRSPDDPSFILNVQLQQNADELDESPSGKLKLREAKANPIFTKIAKNTQQSRPLGPPSPQLTMAVFKPLSPSPAQHSLSPQPYLPTSNYYQRAQTRYRYQTKPIQTQYRVPIRQYISSTRGHTLGYRYYYPYSNLQKTGPVTFIK